MATSKPLQRLLLSLRRLFLSILNQKSIPRRAVAAIFRRLRLWWGAFRFRWRILQLKRDGPPSSPRKTVEEGPKGVEGQEEMLSTRENATMSNSSTYNFVKDGESVNLSDADYSLYPYSNGARSASRSLQSLQVARDSHHLTIIARNASRSSQLLGSDYSHSHSAHSVNSGNSDEHGYTVEVQPSSPRPNPLTPRRQFSTSLPELQHGIIPLIPLNTTSTSASPAIEVFSPGGGPAERIEFAQSQSPVPCHLEHDRILPVMPENTQRYIKRPFIKKKDKAMTIEPLKTRFLEPIAPHGWIKCIHPEGARYFYNTAKRIYTETDLFDEIMFEQFTADIKTIEDYISEQRIAMPRNHHLVLNSNYGEDRNIESFYYFADHDERSIFFLDSYDAHNMSGMGEIFGCKTDGHLGHEIEAQYWYFVQLYPDSVPLTSSLIAELRDVALHYVGDSMTSAYSTSPYHLNDLHHILGLTSQIEKNIGLKSVGATSLLTRLLYVFSHARFHNFHGEGHARIERDTSVYGASTTQRTLLIKTLSMFLFSAPDVHLRTLQKMWVDGLMHKAVWEQQMKKMTDEWQEFILFATVLLNANVAFLAIQSVDVSQQGVSYRSPAQISSYLSIIASIGSIILGLLLIRQNRTDKRETADDVQRFMQSRSHPLLGLETLAILFSLPYALLMWGMVSFLAAFCCNCFQISTISTRVVIGCSCAAVGFLVAWCVWSSWEPPAGDNGVEYIPPSPSADDKSTIASKGGGDDSDDHDAQATGPARILGSIGHWMPSFDFFGKLRRGSLDSQKTAVV